MPPGFKLDIHMFYREVSHHGTKFLRKHNIEKWYHRAYPRKATGGHLANALEWHDSKKVYVETMERDIGSMLK